MGAAETAFAALLDDPLGTLARGTESVQGRSTRVGRTPADDDRAPRR